MNKVVVLGANGFIGKNLVSLFSENFDGEIVAFDRFSNYKKSTLKPFHEQNNVHVISGDFLNRDDLANALVGATYVFHLVSSTNPAISANDPFIDMDTNVRGSIELFELCVEQGVKKVIFLSSGGTIYGDVDADIISETIIPRPRSPYGIGKLTIENYLRYFKFTHDLDYIVYRVANPYGPGQNIQGTQGVVPIFINKFINKEPITIFGDGSMSRDYLYIDDLTRMISGSFESDAKYDVYNLGSGVGETVNQIVDAIEKSSGIVPKKVFIDKPLVFVNKSVLDISRFVNEFNIKPETSLDEGIKKTWEYVKSLQ
jgi:UDP-glucose 4-epimerase